MQEQLWSKHRTFDAETAVGGGGGTMAYSSSVPALAHSLSNTNTDVNERKISKAFQKVKKERAHAEQLISKESAKNQWYREQLELRT